jgi:benzil reductase ((S)-benzoin forming)
MESPLAIVTGASRGIGRATVNELLQRGRTVLGVARSAAAVEHERYTHARVDLADLPALEQFCGELLTECLREASSVDLIQNAGSLDPMGPYGELAAADLERALRIAVVGPHQIAATCLREGRGRLRVLQVSSGAASRAIPGWTAYCTGKAALEMLGRCLAADAEAYASLAQREVQVLSWAPGVVDTRMQEEIRLQPAARFPTVERFEALAQEAQLARPEEVARALVEALERMPAGFSAGRFGG